MKMITRVGKRMLLAGILAGSIFVLLAGAQSPAPANKPASAAPPVRYLPNRFSKRAQIFYQGVWGVDTLSVRLAESGEMVRFSYRIVDPSKAKLLNDEKTEPSLIDPQAGVQLVIPAMANIGKLRQTGTPEAGKSYWMAFSNKGRLVKRGDRVIVAIGTFRADGLEVQ